MHVWKLRLLFPSPSGGKFPSSITRRGCSTPYCSPFHQTNHQHNGNTLVQPRVPAQLWSTSMTKGGGTWTEPKRASARGRPNICSPCFEKHQLRSRNSTGLGTVSLSLIPGTASGSAGLHSEVIAKCWSKASQHFSQLFTEQDLAKPQHLC